MRKWLLPMTVLVFGTWGLPGRAETSKQVRFTVQTFPGNLASSRELLPKKNPVAGEVQSFVLPKKTTLPKDPKAGRDIVTFSTRDKTETYSRFGTDPSLGTELRLTPTINPDSSIRVIVQCIRWQGNKSVKQASFMNHLRQGERLLVAPTGGDVYVISADTLVVADPIKTPEKL